MSRHNTRDGNAKNIIAAFRALGASVLDLSDIGHGIPDILVGIHGKMFMVEIKTGDGKLSPKQNAFIQQWAGKIFVVRTEMEAIRVFREYMI